MALALSRRDLRTLTRGAFVIGAVMLVGRGGPAWRRWDADRRIEAARLWHDVAAARLGIQQGTPMRDSVVARRQRMADVAGRVIGAASAEEASAVLAALVADHAADADVAVNAVQIRPDSAFTSAGFGRVAVRINATGDVAGLTTLLSSLEQSDTLVALRELTVGQPEPAAPDTRIESLHFELVVEALAMRTPGSAPPVSLVPTARPRPTAVTSR